jgi:hypothetical protein
MTVLTYNNSKTTLPNWVDNLHEQQARGCAYETDTHFVHFYCSDRGWYTLSSGLTVVEAKNGTLRDWVSRVFGAVSIAEVNQPAGEAISGVWRPGLFYDDEILTALKSTLDARHSEMVSLRIFLEKLEELFLFIEPDTHGLTTHSHKSRELLILACTEVENQWKMYVSENGIAPVGGNYSTNDYVKLLKPLHLAEWKLTSKPYPMIGGIMPFASWNSTSPTQSLHWYNAYNQTKHDRTAHFDKATLLHAIDAVCASIILFAVRHSPYSLVRDTGSMQSLFGQLFEIELVNFDPRSYYVPKIELPPESRSDLFCYDSYKGGELVQWTNRGLTI